MPVSLQVKGESKVEGAGYRFAEVGSQVGPAQLNVQARLAAHRQPFRQIGKSKATCIEPKPSGNRRGRIWMAASPLNYQRREFASQAGSEDRALAESRWLVRLSPWSLRLEHRLTRSQALSQSEEYVPVEEGRGDYRQVNGQIIADPLGNLIRVVNPAAYGEVARQSEKRAHLSYAPGTGLQGELDLITAETAALADLPDWQWLLPWYLESGSPTQRRILQGALSGGPLAWRWNLRAKLGTQIKHVRDAPGRFRRRFG